jgi:hypothetical protein
MNPCLTRCMECVFIEEVNKRVRCTLGYFDVKSSDGILLVPYDFECINFVQRDLNDKEKREN